MSADHDLIRNIVKMNLERDVSGFLALRFRLGHEDWMGDPAEKAVILLMIEESIEQIRRLQIGTLYNRDYYFYVKYLLESLTPVSIREAYVGVAGEGLMGTGKIFRRLLALGLIETHESSKDERGHDRYVLSQTAKDRLAKQPL